jgi:hypothetical protein
MTQVNIDEQNLHIAVLQAIIDDSEAFERLTKDEQSVSDIYERPYLVEMFENAVTAYDNAKFIETEQEEFEAKSETTDDGFLAAFAPVNREPNFGQKMAQLRKQKGRSKSAKTEVRKAEDEKG